MKLQTLVGLESSTERLDYKEMESFFSFLLIFEISY